MELPLPARAAVLVFGCAWMLLGPFDRQVLGRDDRIFKAWRMYSGKAVGECVADWFVPDGAGGWTEVSRLEVMFDEPRWWRLAPPQRHLRSADAVKTAGWRMCNRLGVEDLRADARCSDTVGWRVVEDRGRNLCRP